MKVWIAGLLGLTVVAVGAAILLRPGTADVAEAVPSEAWRPAKQVTLSTPEGGTRTMHLQQDPRDLRNATMQRITEFDLRWNDAVQLADSTPRIALAGPANSLQKLAQESRTVELSDCFAEGRGFWTAGLEARARATLAFMVQVPSGPSAELKAAQVNLGSWAKVVDACR